MKSGSQLFKGSLSTIVLKLLNEQEWMYGYEITKKVQELSGGKLQLTEGALYPALHKLEAEGLLEVSVEQVGNRPRKYYRLTRQGQKEVRSRLQEFKDFVAQMELILNLRPI